MPMDPLSITVSALTLLGVAKRLIQGLTILLDLSKVPDEIAELIDELYSFQDAIIAVSDVCDKRRRQGLDGDLQLHEFLVKAYNVFLCLGKSCGIELQNAIAAADSGPVKVGHEPGLPDLDLLSRFRWIKDKKKVLNCRQRLQVLRIDISNRIAAVTLHDTSAVLFELRCLARSVSNTPCPTPVESQNEIDPERDLTVSAPSDCAQQQRGQGYEMVEALDSALHAANDASAMEEVPSSESRRPDCLSSCSCSCHRVAQMKTPKIFGNLVGSGTVQLSGVAPWTRMCDEIGCRKALTSLVRLSYRFPTWITQRAIYSTLQSSHIMGPQLSISSTRIIAQNSELFCEAIVGNTQAIKSLFSQGKASPMDVTHNYGYTALHYAVDYCHIDLIEFLFKVGSKPEVQDNNDRSAIDLAYHKICSSKLDQKIQHRYRDLFQEEAWLESKQLTTLHKIVLDLLRPARSLKDELVLSTRAINAPDSDGRTPLSWAAERGDLASTAILLDFGANPNIPDAEQNSPLHFACEGPNPQVVKKLLDHGADAAARNKWAQTPLNHASYFNDDPEFAQLLLCCDGVEIDEIDNYGVTALSNASFNGHEHMFGYLLQRGADINLTADDGYNALFECINRNNHKIFKVLLEQGPSCGLDIGWTDAKGEQCLHALARRADETTMTMFCEAIKSAATDLGTLSASRKNRDGLTPRDMSKLRGDETLYRTLCEILSTIEQESEQDARSEVSEDLQFYDSFEVLSDLENDIGVKIAAEGLRVVEIFD